MNCPRCDRADCRGARVPLVFPATATACLPLAEDCDGDPVDWRARALDGEHNLAVMSALEANWRRMLGERQAEVARLRAALAGLRRGDCWCEFGIGNPMLSRCLPACETAREALEDTK